MERITEAIDRDGYRANVGIVLACQSNEVLWARSAKNRGWQFPQGGIDVGETVEEALYRELYEELGLASGDVKVIGCTDFWLRYNLPMRYQRRHANPRCLGQKQLWYVLRLVAGDEAIKLTAVDHPEFDSWHWVEWWHPLRDVIYFKRQVYDRVLTHFAPMVFPDGPPARPQRERAGRWLAPRSPYHVRRGVRRRERRSRSETAPESR